MQRRRRLLNPLIVSAPEDGGVGRVAARGTVVDERSADRDAALAIALACFRKGGRQSELVEVVDVCAGGRWGQRHRLMI